MVPGSDSHSYFPEPRFWGVGHLRPLPPATDHATECSRTIVSELIGSVNTRAFVGTNPTGKLIISGLPATHTPTSSHI